MPKPVWFKREIIVATTDFEHEAVKHAQRILRCDVTGEMDDSTISHLRGFQLLFGLPTTGTLNEQTAREIERIRMYGSV